MPHDEARTWKAVAYDTLEKENAELKESLRCLRASFDWFDFHSAPCNHRHQPIGGPGCICVVTYKENLKTLYEKNAELMKQIAEREARIAILESRLNPEDTAIYDK